jgi:hypothetical protein
MTMSTKIKINNGRNYFGLLITNGKTYVLPGWHEVPNGTTRDDIELVYDIPSFQMEHPTESTETSVMEWEVEGSKGAIYKVTLRKNRWDCTCPARTFRRGDCKHIKLKKSAI